MFPERDLYGRRQSEAFHQANLLLHLKRPGAPREWACKPPNGTATHPLLHSEVSVHAKSQYALWYSSFLKRHTGSCRRFLRPQFFSLDNAVNGRAMLYLVSCGQCRSCFFPYKEVHTILGMGNRGYVIIYCK